ncbi:MAG: hypothetical protein ACOCXJ_03255, partial [Planctomycetota bacterium]
MSRLGSMRPPGMRVVGMPWVLGLAALAVLIWARWEGAGEQMADAATSGPTLAEAELRHYALVDRDQGLTVHLGAEDQEVRLVSILEWPRERLHEALAEPQPYALRCSLLDAFGDEIWSGLIWQQSRKTRRRTGDGRVIEPAAYASGAATLLDPRLVTVPVDDIAPGAARLHVSLAEPAGLQAVVQTYRLEQEPGPDVIEDWYRLPQDERERQATSNLFDASAIGPEELTRLMRYRWTRLAPAGIPGQHFQPVEIYRARRDVLPDEPPASLEPIDLLELRPDREQVFNAFGPGILRCRLRSLDPDQASMITAELLDRHERRVERIPAAHDVPREL